MGSEGRVRKRARGWKNHGGKGGREKNEAEEGV